MKDNKRIALSVVSGLLFLMLVLGIRHATNQELSLIGLISAFLFGSLIGLLGTTQHTSFIKNIIFTGAIIWLIWAAFTPIQTVGDNWIINKPYLVLGITAFVFLAEKQFLNIFRKIPAKKIGIGLISAWFVYWLMRITGIERAIINLLQENPLQAIIVIQAWIILLIILIVILFRKIILKIYRKIRGWFNAKKK